MIGDGTQQRINVTRDFGDRYADTGGCKFVKIFATPGWRITLVCYSHQYEITAYEVPTSDRYPEGIKYSMQYGNAAGETIIRYDNFPDHPDAAHHHIVLTEPSSMSTSMDSSPSSSDSNQR